MSIDRVESFYDIQSRRKRSTVGVVGAGGVEPSAGVNQVITTSKQIRLTPTDISPVRWRTHRAEESLESQCRSLSPQVVIGGAQPSATHPMAAATLPLGWRPASVEFDNVVQHRLWLLDDGCNVAEIRRLESPPNFRANAASPISQRRLRPPLTPSSTSVAQRETSTTVQHDSTTITSPPMLGVTRPLSGDPLLRVYQLKASMQTPLAAQPGPLSVWSGGSGKSTSSQSFCVGASGSLPPRRSSAALVCPPRRTVVSAGALSAQERITNAAARIAAVASELGSTSVQQSTSLQRVLRQKKVDDEARALLATSDDGDERRSSGSGRRVDNTADANRRRSVGSAGGSGGALFSTTMSSATSFGRFTDSIAGVGSVAWTESTLRRGVDESSSALEGSMNMSVSLLGRRGPSPTFGALNNAVPDATNTTAALSPDRAAVSSPSKTLGGGLRRGTVTFVAPPSAPSADDEEVDRKPPQHNACGGPIGRQRNGDIEEEEEEGERSTTIIPTEDFPFTHLLSNEDVLLLAELAGTDGVMEDVDVTGDIWSFEHTEIRAMAKAGLLDPPEVPIVDHERGGAPHHCGVHPAIRRVREGSLNNQRSECASSSFLDDQMTLSTSAKCPLLPEKRRKSSTATRLSTSMDPNGTERRHSVMRESEALTRKMKALERCASVLAMPQISLESFDVGSPTFHERLKRDSHHSSRGAAGGGGALVAPMHVSPLLSDAPSDEDDEGAAVPNERGEGEEQQPPASSSSSSKGVGGQRRSTAKVLLFDADPRSETPLEGTPTSAGGKGKTLERRIAGGVATRSSPSKQSHGVAQIKESPVLASLTKVTSTTPQRAQSIVDFFGKHAKTVVPEGDTFIPTNELHLYQLFCHNTNMILIFRPVSPSVPPMYAGNFFVPPQYCDEHGIPLMINEIDQRLTLQDVLDFTVAECRVKGKGIGVSLKSSPYPPIDGFIPTNPSLSKTYSEARRKERALEDNLISQAAGGGDAMSTALLRKMRSQKSLFSAATSVAMKEIEASLKDSDHRLEVVLEAYRRQSSYAVDKLAVAEEYIGMLNESQFLGKAVACWRGMPVYYKQLPGDADVERRENAHPIFYCLKGTELFCYDLERNELDLSRPFPASADTMGTVFHPVYILTHRSFVISPISKRIEPDPLGDFLIGPDFDGFAYAASVVTSGRATAPLYRRFADEQMDLRVLPTMGLVNDIDIEHILEMRRLTEWKQSHGYECSNTLKTQDISDGPHVIVMPNEIRLAHNFPELMTFYREAWQCGYPLLLNPNWRVVLSPVDHLPVTLGDELSLPIVDDCGLALLKHHLSSVGRKLEDVKDDAVRYIEELVSMRKQGLTRLRVAGMYSTSLIPRVAIVLARKKLADYFYKLRRWMLFPPLFEASKLNSFDDDDPSRPDEPLARGETTSSSRALVRKTSTVFTAGRGGREAAAVPVSDAFEQYRSERVSELRALFDEECAVFDSLFGGDDPRFVRRLKHYVDPIVAAQASLDAAAGGGRNTQQDEVAMTLLDPKDVEDVAKGSDRGAGLSASLAAGVGGRKTSAGGTPFVPSVAADGDRPFS